MNRKKALILFIIYTVLLVLIISFGSTVSIWLRDTLVGIILDYEITDVEIALDPNVPLTAGEHYYLEPRAVGKFGDEGGLRFKSSDKKVLQVNSDGKITAIYNFEGSEATADVIITSSQDENFSKTVTFTVRKEYTSDFSSYYYIKNYDVNKKEVCVGMVIYPYVLTRDGIDRTRDEFIVEYDGEYFRYDEDEGGYVAIKETPAGETVYFTLSYPNGARARTPEFSIIPYEQIDSFDTVIIREKDADGATLTCNVNYIPQLYKDGKPVQSRVEVSCSAPEKLKESRLGRLVFKEAGDFELTFTLPNGFSRTVALHVKNNLSLPEFDDKNINDTKIINAEVGASTTVNFSFATNITYKKYTCEFDEEMLTVKSWGSSLSIVGKKTGTTKIKLIFDDGYDRIEGEYTVEVGENTSDSTVKSRAIGNFVSKVIGHIGLFCLLGILAYNYFRFLYIKSKATGALIMTALGLPTAVITELIQTFMDGRTAALTDIITDMFGYALGALICYLFIKGADKRAKKVYIWTAIDLSGQADGLIERAREVSERIGAENPALSLPMHISLKISCQIKTKKLPSAVERLTKKLASAESFSITPEQIEKEGGAVWIRHRESEQLAELHEWATDLFLAQYGVKPHGYDLDFAYHTSLFVGNEEEATRAFALLKDEPLPETLTAQRYVIGVSESGKAGEYRVIKSTELEE